VKAGLPANYATDGLHKVSGTKVLIGRDAGGLYARSSLCTHKSCNLNTQGSILANGGAHCGCHGAEFDANGKATKGPASGSLPSYKLTLECDGNLWVDPATPALPIDRVVA
jgi:nitrite reductase/ring-hydroxylating ferredoxin subunit